MPIDSSGSICTATVRLICAAYSMELPLSPLPDVWEVPGEPSGDDEQAVYPDVISLAGISPREPLCRNCDAAEPIFVQRPGGGIGCASLLHFDEGDDPTAACNQIDFSAGHAGTLCKDAPSL
jgi:hypothetical protein